MSEVPEAADKPSLRRHLVSRFSNPWVGLLGTIFSAVGVGLAIYFYFGGTRTRRLTYSVNPVKTIVVKGGEASTLRVLHGDQEIKGDVTAAQVAIWNDGTESIRPENVLSPLCIVLRPSVPILEAKIRKVSRGVIGAAIDGSLLTDGVVSVTWKILEHDDGAVIQLIFAGSTETDIAVDGAIEGQPTVLHVRPPQRIHSPTEQLALVHRDALMLASMSCALLLSMVAALLLLRTRMRASMMGVPERLFKAVTWVTVVILFVALLVVWRELRQPGPPFGF